MVKQQFIIALGWACGQFLTIALMVYFSQKDKDITYPKAFKIYFNKEMGNLVIGLAMLIIAMFIAPDYFDDQLTREELRNKKLITWREKAIWNQRLMFVGFGVFCQLIAIGLFKKGQNAVNSYIKKLPG